MDQRPPQPRWNSNGAVSRADSVHRLLLAAIGLLAGVSGCAPSSHPDEAAQVSPPAAAGGFQATIHTTAPESPPNLDPLPPLPTGPVPVLGTDSPLVARGFDARARQSSMSPRAAMEEFQQHFENRRFAEALGTLESLLRDRPDDPNLLYLIAVTHRAADHSNQAAPTLERVIAIDPQHLEARKLLCIIWTEAGRCTEAEAQMNPLISAGTADAEAWALRGAARLRCGDLASAAADAAQSLQIDPRMHKALLVRCAVAMRRGQLDSAREDLVAARQAGAPESNWQPLSHELARKVAEQQRQSGSAP